MKRAAMVFAAAFALSAALGVGLTACWIDECKCPSTPPRPTAQAPLSRLEVASFDSRGGFGPLTVKPENGTLEVTGDTVVIQYQQAGVQHRVVYEVVGPH